MIFISYRRNDEPGYVGRLADGLREYFGSTNVFLDIDNMASGESWQSQLETKIKDSTVVLAIIGKNWEAELLERNEQHIMGEDIHRFELSYANTLKKPLLTVMLREAQLPKKGDLGDLHWLLDNHIFKIRDGQNQWKQDVVKLTKAIESVSGLKQNRKSFLKRQSWFVPATAAFSFAIIVVVVLFNRSDGINDVTANGGFASNFPMPLGQLAHEWEDAGGIAILLDAPVGSEDAHILNNLKFPAGSGNQGVLLEQFCKDNVSCIQCVGSPIAEKLRNAALVTIGYRSKDVPVEEEMKTADQSNIWPINDTFKPWENIDKNTGKRTIYSCSGN